MSTRQNSYMSVHPTCSSSSVYHSSQQPHRFQPSKYPQYQHPLYQTPSSSSHLIPDVVSSVRSESRCSKVPVVSGRSQAMPVPTIVHTSSSLMEPVILSGSSNIYSSSGLKYALHQQADVVHLRSRRMDDDKHKQIGVLEEHLARERRERKEHVGTLEMQNSRMEQDLVITSKNLDYAKKQNNELKELIQSYCCQIRDAKEREERIDDEIDGLKRQHALELECVRTEQTKIVKQKGDDMLQYCSKIKQQHADLESECQYLRAQVARLQDELQRQKEMTEVYLEKPADFNNDVSQIPHSTFRAPTDTSLNLEEELQASRRQIEHLTAMNQRSDSELDRFRHHMSALGMEDSQKNRPSKHWDSPFYGRTSSLEDEMETLAEKEFDMHPEASITHDESEWFEPLLPRM